MYDRKQLEAASFSLRYSRDRGMSWEATSERVYVLYMEGVGWQVRRLLDQRILGFATDRDEALMLATGRLTDLARERDGLPALRVA